MFVIPQTHFVFGQSAFSVFAASFWSKLQGHAKLYNFVSLDDLKARVRIIWWAFVYVLLLNAANLFDNFMFTFCCLLSCSSYVTFLCCCLCQDSLKEEILHLNRNISGKIKIPQINTKQESMVEQAAAHHSMFLTNVAQFKWK